MTELTPEIQEALNFLTVIDSNNPSKCEMKKTFSTEDLGEFLAIISRHIQSLVSIPFMDRREMGISVARSHIYVYYKVDAATHGLAFFRLKHFGSSEYLLLDKVVAPYSEILALDARIDTKWIVKVAAVGKDFEKYFPVHTPFFIQE